MASREQLCEPVGFDPQGQIALLVFHPVLQEANAAGQQMLDVLQALSGFSLQVICVMPNADAGGRLIEQAIQNHKKQQTLNFYAVSHMARPQFISWMRHCDIMIGNSSSGIIEAATFATQVVNIGNRQYGRERCANVLDVPTETSAIHAGIEQALQNCETDTAVENLYGDGEAGQRMLNLLVELPLGGDLLNKYNAY